MHSDDSVGPRRIVTIVPTYSTTNVSRVIQIVNACRIAEQPILVVANSRAAEISLEVVLDRHELLRPGCNLGFGAAVNNAFMKSAVIDFQGILICNDDIEILTDDFARLLGKLQGRSTREIVSIDFASHPRAVSLYPTSRQTLVRVSGLSMLISGFIPIRFRTLPFPFHAVYIGRDAALEVLPFSDRYPLYFEDADLIRRATELRIPIQILSMPGIHRRSTTSRQHPGIIGLVAEGATNYLTDHCGSSVFSAQFKIRVSLLCRSIIALTLGRPRESSASLRIAFSPRTGWRHGLPGWD